MKANNNSKSTTQLDFKLFPTLSKNKQQYLADKNYESYQLAAKELPAIVSHFNKKHNIKIVINGETPQGIVMTNATNSPIQDELQASQGNLRYINFMKKYWLDKCSTPEYYGDPIFLWRNVDGYNTVRDIISPFLNTDYELRTSLTDNDLLKLNDILSKPPCDAILNKRINAWQNRLNDQLQDACLTQEQARVEIALIQASLKANEAVGYIYTNNRKITKAHFEVVIITKDMVIQPISWAEGGSQNLNTESYATVKKLPLINAQAGDYECGTLGIMYLKELLKNNHQQLSNYCLQYFYFDKERKKMKQHFFPSPQVLRYSQSQKFNDYFCKMLGDEDSFEIENKHGEKIQGTSLKKILTDSLIDAKRCEDKATLEHNEKLLNNLTQFRESWLKEYKLMESKREKMSDLKAVNRYLAYKTKKLEKISKSDAIKQPAMINPASKVEVNFDFISKQSPEIVLMTLETLQTLKDLKPPNVLVELNKRYDELQKTYMLNAQKKGHAYLSNALKEFFYQAPDKKKTLDYFLNALNSQEKKYSSFIHNIADTGDAQLFRLLIPPEKMHTPDERGWTPVSIAALNGSKQIIQELLEQHGEKKINQPDRDGWDLTHCAAKEGQVNILKVLAEYKSDFENENVRGRTPAYYAAQSLDKDTIHFFVDKIHKPQSWAAILPAINDIKLLSEKSLIGIKTNHNEIKKHFILSLEGMPAEKKDDLIQKVLLKQTAFGVLLNQSIDDEKSLLKDFIPILNISNEDCELWRKCNWSIKDMLLTKKKEEQKKSFAQPDKNCVKVNGGVNEINKLIYNNDDRGYTIETSFIDIKDNKVKMIQLDISITPAYVHLCDNITKNPALAKACDVKSEGKITITTNDNELIKQFLSIAQEWYEFGDNVIQDILNYQSKSAGAGVTEIPSQSKSLRGP